ncbi:MAG: hypothetical protein OEV78_12310 [Spirochaetia bacterium]|nr:hypothetical protein [Spirochaetia bacterium]
MKFYFNRSLVFLNVLVLTGGLFALGSNGKAVTINVQNQDKFLEVEMKIKKDFGIQKKGPHEIVIYSLDKNYTKENDPSKVISEYGKKIQEIKPLKLSGETAKKDNEYFSAVNKFQVPVSTKGDVAIKAKIYYCSFTDSFCSVDVVYAIIPGK